MGWVGDAGNEWSDILTKSSKVRKKPLPPNAPNFNQKFDVIMSVNASSICYTGTLKLSVPDSSLYTYDANDTEPRIALPTVEPSRMRLASVSGWPIVNAISRAKPELSPEVIAGVNNP